MGLGYQFTDRRCVDYEIWFHGELRHPLRGPRALFDTTARYWSFVGAAQTFGRFVQHPFPALVSDCFGMQHVNLGFAGAGPEYFASKPGLLEVINGSSLCFLQIMSGRSVSTTLLKTIGQGGMLKFMDGPLLGEKMLALDAYKALLQKYGRAEIAKQIADVKSNWCRSYLELIGKIRVPTILVWVSSREKNYDLSCESAEQVLGEFPHLITPAELATIESADRPLVGRTFAGNINQMLLDYTSRKPVVVFNKANFEGRPDWSRAFNVYYPTPEMHRSVARDIILFLGANAKFASACPQ
ncbi:MAG TPA: DUF6473 family protein [Rhizomicrobium sp.]